MTTLGPFRGWTWCWSRRDGWLEQKIAPVKRLSPLQAETSSSFSCLKPGQEQAAGARRIACASGLPPDPMLSEHPTSSGSFGVASFPNAPDFL